MNEKPLILVCDDESHIVHVVSLKLRNAGYEVMTAQDGVEGLEIAKQRTPDLLITDFQMPRMNGVELCAAFREDAQLNQVPAMMLTARGFRLDPIEVRQARIAEVLSKPFSPREVLARVQELLTGKEDLSTDAASIDAAA
ncbi:MAG: response regulator [Planctomycetota bacterium]